MNQKNIVVVDYGLCNLCSVSNAFKALGINVKITDNAENLKSADAVILPGVGAFADGMKGLKEKGFIEAIYAYTKTGRPFLGICLGMQLLMTKSYEFGEYEGLNLIEGEVVGFKNRLKEGCYDFKVPHIGWNALKRQLRPWEKTILAQFINPVEVYFVHSFFASPKYAHNILAHTSYAGIDFCSVIAKDNIYGCQFHPEKSAQDGLKILENFIRLCS